MRLSDSRSGTSTRPKPPLSANQPYSSRYSRLRSYHSRSAASKPGSCSNGAWYFELGCGGDTEAEEGSRRLLLGECSLKLRPRFLPRPSLERCLTSFERTRDLIFRPTSRVPKSTPDEREGGTGDQAGPDSSDAARRESLLTGELNTLDRSC